MGCDCFGKMVESMYFTIRVKLLKNKVSAGSSLYMSIQYIYIIWVNILWKSHAHNLHVRPGYDGRWRLRGAVQSPHPTAGSAPGPYQRLPLRSQHLLQWRSPSLPHEGSLPNVQMVKTQSKSVFLLGNFKTWMWIRLSGLTFYNVWHFFGRIKRCKKTFKARHAKTIKNEPMVAIHYFIALVGLNQPGFDRIKSGPIAWVDSKR